MLLPVLDKVIPVPFGLSNDVIVCEFSYCIKVIALIYYTCILVYKYIREFMVTSNLPD